MRKQFGSKNTTVSQIYIFSVIVFVNDGMNVFSGTVGSCIKVSYKPDPRCILTSLCCRNMSHDITIIIYGCILNTQLLHLLNKKISKIKLSVC